LDALRFFLLGLCERCFEFRRELEFIFQEVIEGTAELRELSLGKMVQLGFDLLDLAHDCRLIEAGLRDKTRTRDLRGAIRNGRGVERADPSTSDR